MPLERRARRSRAMASLGVLFTSLGTNPETRHFNVLSSRLEATTVPEPAMVMLLGVGLAAAPAMGRRGASSTQK
jgi:hypothetical protein